MLNVLWQNIIRFKYRNSWVAWKHLMCFNWTGWNIKLHNFKVLYKLRKTQNIIIYKLQLLQNGKTSTETPTLPTLWLQWLLKLPWLPKVARLPRLPWQPKLLIVIICLQNSQSLWLNFVLFLFMANCTHRFWTAGIKLSDILLVAGACRLNRFLPVKQTVAVARGYWIITNPKWVVAMW